MKHTENYNLNKIELTDSPPDITALNPNFDKIDTELKRLTDKDAEIVNSIDKVKEDYLPKTGGNVTNALTIKNKTVVVSVNGEVADANGDIKIDVGGKVQSINGVKPDENGDVKVEFGGGDVQSVDGVEPDDEGNVVLNASTREEILEATKRVSDVEADAEIASVEALQTGLARVETELDAKIKVSGSRGTLSGYETNGTNTTINASAPDSNETGSAITVSNGTNGTSWTKIVRVTASVTVTLGSSWVWQGGSAPTITSGGVLVCCWCGNGGIANFVSPS